MTGHRRLRGTGWGAALRLARRELFRAKARTLLVVVMVLLPVTAVVALDTLVRTDDVSVRESLPRELGTASARLDVAFNGGPVQQTPDLVQSAVSGDGRAPRPTQAQLQSALPGGERLLPVRLRYSARLVAPDGRRLTVEVTGVDLADPALRGPYRVRSGRAPGAGEVAVVPALAPRLPVGSTATVGGRALAVVGVVDGPPSLTGDRVVFGLPVDVGLGTAQPDRYYVSGPAVRWDDVLSLNALGASVLSRAVVLDPPPADQVPDLGCCSTDGYTVSLLVLLAVVAVLEVVLLAGPAFAVGARRQRRALALLAASGGEPRHVRRVVLAQGLLVGVGCAVVGGPLGVAAAALARSPLERWTSAAFGPFDWSPRDVALVCALGAVTSLLAALFPAVVAGRSPLLASLNGARPTPAPPGRAALLGVVLLVVGGLACLASVRRPDAELWVGFSAVPTVLGAVLLAPLLLRLVGRTAGRLPLPLRFAARDADRQRSRTAPAVAAVAATVAGVVALGLAASSDDRRNRETFVPNGPVGTAVVTGNGDAAAVAAPGVVQRARAALPGEPVDTVRGLDLLTRSGEPTASLLVCRPGSPPAVRCQESFGSVALGSPVLVGDDALDALAPLLQPASLAAARRALADGGAAVSSPSVQGTAELRLQRSSVDADGVERAVLLHRTTARVVPLVARRGAPPVEAVLSEPVARALGTPTTVALRVGDDLTRAQEDRLRDALTGDEDELGVFVERGYRSGTRTVLLLIGLAAGLLVLGGTAAATSLALTEARPDLATLGSVGAPPRTRRAVSAGYAWVLATTGAVLGVLAGSVPGVAGAVAITRETYSVGVATYSDEPSHRLATALRFLDVPWLLLLGLVVVLPLLAAGLAALSTRSRLPGLHRRLAA